MAKDKQNKQESSKPSKRGEVQQAMCLLRKAKRVARSSGKPALEAYVAKNVTLKVYFAKDIARLLATARTPKPRAKPEANTQASTV